ncbi:hypothetical protein [Streptomyces sp. NPDC056670]|uniref:hypothetical protein n=1 Tax=Streptomyces sp. NPDC056670 TaxID=3345904 RepID=UPI0036A3EB8E
MAPSVHEKRWYVEVAFAGLVGPPQKLRVVAASPQGALDHTKGRVRNELIAQKSTRSVEYTIGVFPLGCRAGDISMLAETVTLTPCPAP